MKTLAILAAVVIAATGVAAAPATAQSYHERTVERHRSHYEHRDNGRYGGWDNKKWRWRTACHTQWRNGHREKVCRRIRYR